MTIKEILGINNAKLIFGSELTTLENFSKDTRTIKENDTYVGLVGETFNGNLFFKEAYLNGASICVLDEEPEKLHEFLKENNKTAIIVKDSIKFLGELAKYKRDLFKGKVIAITGSSGKTSTKDMLGSILATKYNVYKTEGNLNNHIGLL